MWQKPLVVPLLHQKGAFVIKCRIWYICSVKTIACSWFLTRLEKYIVVWMQWHQFNEAKATFGSSGSIKHNLSRLMFSPLQTPKQDRCIIKIVMGLEPILVYLICKKWAMVFKSKLSSKSMSSWNQWHCFNDMNIANFSILSMVCVCQKGPHTLDLRPALKSIARWMQWQCYNVAKATFSTFVPPKRSMCGQSHFLYICSTKAILHSWFLTCLENAQWGGCNATTTMWQTQLVVHLLHQT